MEVKWIYKNLNFLNILETDYEQYKNFVMDLYLVEFLNVVYKDTYDLEHFIVDCFFVYFLHFF